MQACIFSEVTTVSYRFGEDSQESWCLEENLAQFLLLGKPEMLCCPFCECVMYSVGPVLQQIEQNF